MTLGCWSKVAAGALIVSITTMLAACARPDDDPPNPPTSTTSATPSTTPTPSPTSTSDPELAAAEVAILEAYRGYWATKVTILADPALEPGTTLETFAVDTALTDVYSTVLSFRSDRIVMVGEPVLRPQVTDVVPGTMDLYGHMFSDAPWVAISRLPDLPGFPNNTPTEPSEGTETTPDGEDPQELP